MDDDRSGEGAASDEARRLSVNSGRSGDLRHWQVGGDRIELTPKGRSWAARVIRAGWRGHALDLGGLFATEKEGLAWCEKMIAILALDARDDLDRR